MTNLTPDQRLLEEELSIPFAGLYPEDSPQTDLPARVKRKLDLDGDTASLSELIDLLRMLNSAISGRQTVS
jgi:hypothetical protein